MEQPIVQPEKKSRKRQLLWFFGLYAISVLGLGLFTGLMKLVIPH